MIHLEGRRDTVFGDRRRTYSSFHVSIIFSMGAKHVMPRNVRSFSGEHQIVHSYKHHVRIIYMNDAFQMFFLGGMGGCKRERSISGPVWRDWADRSDVHINLPCKLYNCVFDRSDVPSACHSVQLRLPLRLPRCVPIATVN